ncbi:MAG: isoprenyl transferase [Clostridia bacterium]|nr:isoprenyl transferase [Clostridia bacterium]
MPAARKEQNVAKNVAAPRPEALPRHVAVIMDGNGRWAKKRLLPRSAGHTAGMYKVKTIIRQSSDLGIRYLTLYAFSTENWKRPKAEVGFLMKLLIEFLNQELEEMHARNVIFRTIGDVTALPQPVQDVLAGAVEKTRNNTGLTVNIALNYGSRAEIAEAARRAAQDVKAGKITPEEISEELFSGYLETSGQPDPDLLIRTSGEERLSNFLLFQLAYAEFYFTPVLWPDFDEQEYLRALEAYQGRGRRYGGLES